MQAMGYRLIPKKIGYIRGSVKTISLSYVIFSLYDDFLEVFRAFDG